MGAMKEINYYYNFAQISDELSYTFVPRGLTDADLFLTYI